MRATKPLNSPNALQPAKRASWNSTDTPYDAASAGSITHATTRRAERWPSSRTVRSVTTNTSGKVNAPQVVSTPSSCTGHCTR